METPETIERNSQPIAKKIVAIFVCALVSTVVVFRLPMLKPLALPFAYLILVVLVSLNFLMVKLYQQGRSEIPGIPFILGLLYIIGGTAFDVCVTVIKTPNLQSEENIVARLFLDSGRSLTETYIYGFAAQLLFTFFICQSWATFLRHRKTLTALAWQLQPKSFGEFFNALTKKRLKNSSVWATLWGQKSDYKQFKWYQNSFMLFVVLSGIQFDRWFYGLEWLQLAPFSRNVGLVISFIIGFGILFVWVWFEYSSKSQSIDQAYK